MSTSLTLRRFLLLLVTFGVLYVTAIAAVLAIRVAPAARQLERHSRLVLATNDEAARRLPFLEQSVGQVRLLRERAREAPPSRDTLRTVVEGLRARLDSVSAVHTTATLSGIPPQMRIALANAVTSESAVEIELLRALSELELGRPDSAEAHLHRAESARQRTDQALRAIQRMAVGDLVARQRLVTDLARFASRAVSLWLVIGVVMLPLVAMYVRRRIHVPLNELESALASVAAGDLATTLQPRRQDELGRLAGHFNTMTAVLKQRTEEQHHAHTTERRSLEAQLIEAQRLESIGRLAGGVAHDFNNILTGIIAHNEHARQSLPAGHPASEELDEIARAAGRAADLTRQLLAFARRQVVEPKVVNLNQLTRSLERLLARLLGADIRVETTLDPGLRQTRVDPTQFEQVVVNLAVNARDAMPTGGRLSLATMNIDVTAGSEGMLASLAPGPYVVLRVSDSGTGMDAATMERIFEPFFTTKDRSRGTGLGLATAYGIIKQSGGHINVDSEPGRGTTFRIFLPATSESVAAHTPTSTPALERPGAAGETLLLVEDEEMVRTVLARGLRGKGFTVIEASEGEEAVAMASAHAGHIDMLVTDLVLPTMGGRDIALQVRAARPDIKVLFMSGYSDDALAGRPLGGPDDAFLGKPFTVKQLIEQVRRMLG